MRMNSYGSCRFAILIALLGLVWPVPAGAESLRDALKKKVKQELERRDDSRKSSSSRSSRDRDKNRERDKDNGKRSERDKDEKKSSRHRDRDDDRKRDKDRSPECDDDRHRVRGYDHDLYYGGYSSRYDYYDRYPLSHSYRYSAPTVIYPSVPLRYERYYESSPAPVIYPDSSRAMRSVGFPRYLVVEVQSRLSALGYYHAAIDGIAGSGTRGAIRAYQLHAGLPVTGQIDSALLSALGVER